MSSTRSGYVMMDSSSTKYNTTYTSNIINIQPARQRGNLNILPKITQTCPWRIPTYFPNWFSDLSQFPDDRSSGLVACGFISMFGTNDKLLYST